ncbi:hypothetical protein Tco_1162038 [Tanacetum coccineum]
MTTSIDPKLINIMMITTTSRIEDKNLLGLILPKDTMETFLCVQNAPALQEIALSQCSILATKVGHHDQIHCRDQMIQPLKTTLEDIQLSSESSSI